MGILRADARVVSRLQALDPADRIRAPSEAAARLIFTTTAWVS